MQTTTRRQFGGVVVAAVAGRAVALEGLASDGRPRETDVTDLWPSHLTMGIESYMQFERACLERLGYKAGEARLLALLDGEDATGNCTTLHVGHGWVQVYMKAGGRHVFLPNGGGLLKHRVSGTVRLVVREVAK